VTEEALQEGNCLFTIGLRETELSTQRRAGCRSLFLDRVGRIARLRFLARVPLWPMATPRLARRLQHVDSHGPTNVKGGHVLLVAGSGRSCVWCGDGESPRASAGGADRSADGGGVVGPLPLFSLSVNVFLLGHCDRANPVPIHNF
jgi:hypothetical protein